MTTRLFYTILCGILYWGTIMPVFAGLVHPSGPEERPFTERNIRILGTKQDALVTLAYPKPEEFVDHTSGGKYSVSSSPSSVLYLWYEYRGYFWQGKYGTVILDIKFINRKVDAEPIKELNALLQAVRTRSNMRNERTKGDLGDTRQVWSEPFVSQLNGVPCVQQYVDWGKNMKGDGLYYIPFEDNQALEIQISISDNSDTPGKPPSDWRTRAEAFANRLLSSVKVQLEIK